MSFGKLVTLSMLAAFSAGLGYSYVADPQFRRDATPTTMIVGTATATETSTTPASFKAYTLCSGSARYHCVVDGDTLWHLGVKIRIADVDTPEVGEPQCPSEAALGAKATRRLLQLVNQGPVEFAAWENRDEDKYGRKLRVLIRNGRSLGDVLVSEGLARTWSGRREPWC